MKLLSVLMTVCVADDVETSSLLQSKRDSVKGIDGAAVLDRAAVALNALTPASDVEASMIAFAQELKTSATSVLQLPNSEKDALIKRASQTKELSKFVQSYTNLPADIKEKVDSAAINTPILNEVYDALDPVDSRALLVQLDRTTTGKDCYDRITDLGNRVRECVTRTRNGNGGHTHRRWHGDKESGTETVTREKDGDQIHRHFHRYAHDGSGANAQTDTVTEGKDGYRHGHATSHRIVNGRTFTNTNTDSRFSDGDRTHSHSHSHSHLPGDGTSTNTFTRSTKDGETFHGHGHTHDHNEDNGETRSSSTFCDGDNPNDCKTIVQNTLDD